MSISVGFSDKVKCYACGIGLTDWSTDADPATQHAKASPHCVFLLHAKGKQFIVNAQNAQVRSNVFLSSILSLAAI